MLARLGSSWLQTFARIREATPRRWVETPSRVKTGRSRFRLNSGEPASSSPRSALYLLPNWRARIGYSACSGANRIVALTHSGIPEEGSNGCQSDEDEGASRMGTALATVRAMGWVVLAARRIGGRVNAIRYSRGQCHDRCTRRAERFRKGLREEQTITRAMYGARFGASSRCYEAVGDELGRTPTERRTNATGRL